MKRGCANDDQGHHLSDTTTGKGLINQADEMRVVHTVGGIAERFGGPSRTVTSLCTSIGRQCIHVDLVAGVDRSVDARLIRPDIDNVGLRLVDAWTVGRLNFYPGFVSTLHGLLGESAQPGLIHDHGIWGATNFAAWRASRACRVPYVLSPRGMLEPWALEFKSGKKKIAWLLYQRRIVAAAAALIATSEQECASVKRLFPKLPVAIIPNGVDLAVGPLSAKVTQKDRQRLALFLSRVHPKKGILNLLNAWALAAPKGWRLQIAGPNEGWHLAEVMALARKLGIDHAVDYLGELAGDAKVQTYLGADLFVLPTFSENFGVVVAEALAHGLPVITTRGAPWADLEAFGCGWWVDIGVDPLVHALREAMALSDDERREMGERGRAYVRRYDWDDIARQTIDVYRWVLGHGPQPDCVRTD